MHKFPGYRWDAEGNAHLCKGPEDVKEGWTDQHPSNITVEVTAAPPDHPPPLNELPPPPEVPVDEMSREEIVTALNEGGVQFSKNAPTAALYKKLRAAAQEALTASGIEFDPNADAKTLLALIPKPE